MTGLQAVTTVMMLYEVKYYYWRAIVMERGNFWTRYANQRRTRRQLLAAGGTVAAAAAALAAVGCGGGDGEEEAEGLLKPLKDRSGQAKQGGTLAHTQLNTTTLDGIGSPATLTRFGISAVYNRLFKVLPGVNKPSSGEKVGDVVDTWETSPDGLRLTLKLRRNVGTDPRPPTNGRALDADDVIYSWNKWSTVNALRSDLVNSINKDAPVESVTNPDKNTVVFKLAFPSVILLDYLTDGFYLWIMPKEADGGFNPNGEARGGGPFIMDEFLAGAHYKMSRNPNYYDKPVPYFDKMNWFVVPEQAAALGQFEAKQLDLSAGVTNDNVVDVKNRHPETNLYSLPILQVAATSRFGYAPNEPYRDVRVRRAISHAYDREALAEYFTSKSKLEAAGLPVPLKMASHLSAMWPITTDPRDEKAFGPNAKYFKRDATESKALLSAAKQENLEIEYHIDNFSPINIADAELLAGQLRDAGFKVNQKVENYANWFLPTVYRGKGNWTGMAHGAVGYKFSPEVFLYSYFHTSPGTSHYPAGIFDDLVSRTAAISRELDDKKRATLVKEFEQAAAAEMPSLPLGSSGPTYILAWPWVAQAGVLNQWPGDGVGERNTLYSRFWFDAEAAKQYGKT